MASFTVRRQGVISVGIVLRRGVIIVIRGVVVVIQHGHHRTWAGHHHPGGRSFRVTFAGGARSSFVGPVVVDVGCRLVVVGPRSPLMAWHPHGHSSVVWVVAIHGWVMVIVDGGWCLWAVVVCGWAAVVVPCGWSSFVGGGWWSSVVVLSFVVVGSWAFIVWKAAVNVECPDGRATSAVWWWHHLLGAIAVAISIVDVGHHCRHCRHGRHCLECESLCGGGGERWWW